MIFFTDRDLSSTVFVAVLRQAGLTVERHDDHFEQNADDPVWLTGVGQKGWIALSRNYRIYYSPNERDATMRAGTRLFVIIGPKVPFPELARNFLLCIHKIEKFVKKNPPPFIARIYCPMSEEKLKGSHKSGSVVPWLSHKEWLEKLEKR